MCILIGMVKDEKVHISTFGTSNAKLVMDVYADVGKQITQTAEYQRNAVKVTKAFEEMDTKAIEEVGNYWMRLALFEPTHFSLDDFLS